MFDSLPTYSFIYAVLALQCIFHRQIVFFFFYLLATLIIMFCIKEMHIFNQYHVIRVMTRIISFIPLKFCVDQ